jgi:hypothetical protein
LFRWIDRVGVWSVQRAWRAFDQSIFGEFR